MEYWHFEICIYPYFMEKIEKSRRQYMTRAQSIDEAIQIAKAVMTGISTDKRVYLVHLKGVWEYKLMGRQDYLKYFEVKEMTND